MGVAEVQPVPCPDPGVQELEPLLVVVMRMSEAVLPSRLYRCRAEQAGETWARAKLLHFEEEVQRGGLQDQQELRVLLEQIKESSAALDRLRLQQHKASKLTLPFGLFT